jgi:FMN phosphatase YigB (HAD superfamily)
MKAESREYGLTNGISPQASKVVLVDFDGTLFPFDELFSLGPPEPGAREAMAALVSAGYKVRVFSSRLSLRWLADEDESYAGQKAHMLTRLNKWCIPHHGIATDKEPAEFYIDDRAIRYNGSWDDVVDEIKVRAAVTRGVEEGLIT